MKYVMTLIGENKHWVSKMNQVLGTIDDNDKSMKGTIEGMKGTIETKIRELPSSTNQAISDAAGIYPAQNCKHTKRKLCRR